MKFTVYGQPQGKGRPRLCVRGGFARAYPPDDTVSYENLIKMSYIESFGKDIMQLTDKPLNLDITAVFTIPKSFSKIKANKAVEGKLRPTTKPDTDNIIKVVCDGLNGVAYKDDKQIVKICASKIYGIVPRLEINIVDLEE